MIDWAIRAFTMENIIPSYFTISKSYFINYTISFYNAHNIPKLYYFTILLKYYFLILLYYFFPTVIFFFKFNNYSNGQIFNTILLKYYFLIFFYHFFLTVFFFFFFSNSTTIPIVTFSIESLHPANGYIFNIYRSTSCQQSYFQHI